MDDFEIGGVVVVLSVVVEGAGVTKAVGGGGGGVGGLDVFNVCGNVFVDIVFFDGVEFFGMNGIFILFMKFVILIIFLFVCSRFRELLFISARMGKLYGLLLNGCLICLVVVLILNRVRERMVVMGMMFYILILCIKIIGNEYTYIMSVDFKWVMM